MTPPHQTAKRCFGFDSPISFEVLENEHSSMLISDVDVATPRAQQQSSEGKY